MFYKYKLKVTDGIHGSVIRHTNTESTFEFGRLDDYVYIKADNIDEQSSELNFEAVDMTDELLEKLLNLMPLKIAKNTARAKIRSIKDFEDDLTDLKKVVQFMARGFAGLWSSLPDDIKANNPYRDNFDMFSEAVATTEFRLDLEANQAKKIAKILQDESEFASIVKDEYLDKLK